MISRFSIQTALSSTLSASVVAAAAVTSGNTVGDEPLPQGENGDSLATPRSPFVPHKIADVYDSLDDSRHDSTKQLPRPISGEMEASNGPVDEVHNLVPVKEDGSDESKDQRPNKSKDTEATVFNASEELGLLVDGIAAPGDASNSRQLQSEGIDCGGYYPLVGVTGYEFAELVELCLLGECPYDGNIGCWDTGDVTDMSFAFAGEYYFDEDIGEWDTGQVTTMQSMFESNDYFNQDISDWSTGLLTNMKSMFQYAYSFNQPIGVWDTADVKNMYGVFSYASDFNQNINGWITSRVFTMSYMFENASAFNNDVSDWNTKKVKDMGSMFRVAYTFNQFVGDWNTTKVTSMFKMFNGADAFNYSLENWDVSNVSQMGYMFEFASSFNQPLDSWDVSDVERMYGMFKDASSFNQCLSTWSSKVAYVDTSYMFFGSGCPITDDPVPNGESWCQGYDECQASCENSSFDFSLVGKTSCDEVANLSTKTIKDLCDLLWGISTNCPELCPRNERCPCTDYSLPFQGTSCAFVSELKKKKREKKCSQNVNIYDNCPGTCSFSCAYDLYV